MQVVTTHKNTDFDALASVVAATILYPGTIPVLPKTLNPNVKAFLSIHILISIKSKHSLLLILTTGGVWDEWGG